MREFEDRLAARGIPVTVRDTRGSQIDGACGQLAAPSLAPGARVPERCRSAPGYRSRSCRARRLSPGVTARWPWRVVHRAWQAAQQAGAITAATPAGRRFAAFGPGSIIAFPAGALYGERVDRGRRGHADRGRRSA